MISRERLRQGRLHAKRRVPEWYYQPENPVRPGYIQENVPPEGWRERNLRRRRKTTAPCSNPRCCGHRREVEGPTMQERRARRVDE